MLGFGYAVMVAPGRSGSGFVGVDAAVVPSDVK